MICRRKRICFSAYRTLRNLSPGRDVISALKFSLDRGRRKRGARARACYTAVGDYRPFLIAAKIPRLLADLRHHENLHLLALVSLALSLSLFRILCINDDHTYSAPTCFDTNERIEKKCFLSRRFRHVSYDVFTVLKYDN